MCLYPRTMTNKKYTVTKKNGGNVPSLPIIGSDSYGYDIYDNRISTVQIPCGRCSECLKARARNWQIRLGEEIKETKYNYFVTLTFAPGQLEKLLKKTHVPECNAIMGIAIRRCLERWRKDHKKSIKHWFITELGHEGTERIHAHGILFSDKPLEFTELEKKPNGIMAEWKYWKYGNVFVGDWVNSQTVNYLMKYVCKIDTDHKNFVGYVFTSPGMGKNWLETMRSIYKYVPGGSLDYYRMPDGHKIKLPIYYKNHLYNEDERELIWRDILDKDETIIAGNKYYSGQLDNSTEGRIRTKAQEINTKLGYGNDSKEWMKEDWSITPAMLRKGQNEDKQRAQILKEHLEKMSNYRKMIKIRKKKLKNLQKQNNLTTFATENDVKYDTLCDLS